MAFASFRRLLATRRLAWVLAWALCLPIAQWASATHALLHLGAAAAAADHRDKPAQLPAFCDTCVVAAAIGGAVPLPAVIPPRPFALPQLQPAAPALPERFAAFTHAYRSRAPPLPHA